MTQRRQFCPHGHDTFLVGRDSSYRCLECKRLDSWQARAARVAEAQAVRAAELKRNRAEAERRRKRERDRALAAGGDAAAEARWQELWSDTLGRTGYGLCQWSLENGRPGACTRVVKEDGQVYCGVHNRQLEREGAFVVG
jgi:hypothetical protein